MWMTREKSCFIDSIFCFTSLMELFNLIFNVVGGSAKYHLGVNLKFSNNFMTLTTVGFVFTV